MWMNVWPSVIASVVIVRTIVSTVYNGRRYIVEEYTRELIAVGAAVCTNCQPCLKYLVDKVRKKGASEEDIAEALSVGGRIRDGAVRKMDGFAESLISGGKPIPDRPAGGCGCG
jgi:AhpD family alkylhydroperoxidase